MILKTPALFGTQNFIASSLEGGSSKETEKVTDGELGILGEVMGSGGISKWGSSPECNMAVPGWAH